MTSQPYLEIHNVIKQFGQFTALKGIDLHIQQGEFVCFLGPRAVAKPHCCVPLPD
ncbi:hypothetical protein [Vibrio furnissii]|uniref:hypothetical protein n=1 Tax=Vibrio furnissii TaxID=29494 RepID=UPI003BB1D4BC